MAQAVSADTNMINILKTWYTDEKLENLLFRNSPVAKKINKIKIGGKSYNFSMFYGRGGAVSGDYTVAIANNTATGTALNAELSVPPGKIYSVFTFGQLEMLASTTGKGAYIQAAVDKMFAATESLRKTFAAALYGSGYGEIGNVLGYTAAQATVAAAVTAVIAAPSTFTTGVNTTVAISVSPDAAMKVDIGTVLNFQGASTDSIPGKIGLCLTSLSTATYYGQSGTAEFTVTSISSPFVNTGVTYVVLGGNLASAPTNVAAFDATSLACLKGSRTAATSGPNLPSGLASWLPAYGTSTASWRSSANWATYIGTAFYGQDRSVAVDRLAGNYTGKTPGGWTKYYETLLDGIKLCRRNGGLPDMIVINDNDYGKLLAEVNASTTMFQSVNTTPNSKTSKQFGLSDMGFQFSTNWLQYVYDDPYCPVNKAYILDSSVVSFVGLSNSATPIDDGIAGNNPGSQSVTDMSAPDMTFKFLIDDYLNVVPGTATADGPAALVSLSLYGNFIVRNPAHCAVVTFL